MLKGMGISSIIKLVLAVMIASLFISLTTIGSLGDAIQHSFGTIDSITDFTVEVEDGDQLSDLAMFVRDRAVSCEEVEDRHEGETLDGYPLGGEEGYPHLSHVGHLGQYAPCFGGETSVLRDTWQVVPGRGLAGGGPEDNYMPGIYSREQFEVTESITFSESDQNYWLDQNIAAFSNKYFETHISDLGEDERFSQINTDFEGTGRNYVFFFEPDGSERANFFLEDIDDFEDRVWYCGGDFANCDSDHDSLSEAVEDIDFRIRLCPGDKGYIQINRGTPHNEGLSDETGSENYYPRIVIEETGDEVECEGIDSGRLDKLPDGLKTSGRMLHITGKTSASYPFVRGPGSSGSLRHYAFDFYEFNENDDEVDRIVGSSGRNIQFNHNSNRAEECVIGMWDHRSSAVDSTGPITFEQGTHIDYNGRFPSRNSPYVSGDFLGDRTSRSIPPYPSARNLYDQFADIGFNGNDWTTPMHLLSVEDKILYDWADEKRFELYGDLLCGPDNRNIADDFDNDHATWYMCDGDTDPVEIDGETWTCDMDGKWSN